MKKNICKEYRSVRKRDTFSEMILGKNSIFNFRKRKNIMRALLFRGKDQQSLFRYARQTRDEIFSKWVEVRSVIEYSNICQQECNYCGMSNHSGLKRYILSNEDVIENVDALYRNGRKVIMVQTGEFYSRDYFDNLCFLLKEIKERYGDLTLICSLSNLPRRNLEKLRKIGVERYLLKFETSDADLYRKVKPSDTLENRIAHIIMAQEVGLQVSSGNITGLPGQTLTSLADDLLLIKKLKLSMGSTSAFIPNDLSSYAHFPAADIHMVLNFMAILRLLCPSMLIPATSSLELLVKDGQYMGLMAGANVVTAHDGTPSHDEDRFVIYRSNRHKPRDILLTIIRKAFLEPFTGSLLSN